MGYFGKNKILLPKNVEMEKWAVVACDQFTSQPDYWKKLEGIVGSSPSTLRLTLPEIYLNYEGVKERIQNIKNTMASYERNGIFTGIDGFVLVEREVEHGKKRIGIVLSVDLEAYDWRRIRCPIRATEDTILDRLPPRIEIRKGAPIELPHILLLIDDRKKEIIEPLYAKRNSLKKLYDFNLSMGGGRITGYHIEECGELEKKFEGLLNPAVQTEKYGSDAGVMFAVGDGNHSLAVAKTMWEEIKKGLTPDELESHPARYALVEVVNLYDDALLLEPIHRVVIGAGEEFITEMEKSLKGGGKMKLIFNGKERFIGVNAKSSEAIGEVQRFIESYVKTRGGVTVDYIHGDNYLKEVAAETGGIGLFMPVFTKEELFPYVINIGNLPKKAFSIGGAEFKKYYLEAKKIIKD